MILLLLINLLDFKLQFKLHN